MTNKKGILVDWIDYIFGFRVEKKEIRRPGDEPYLPRSDSGIGVLHTTEIAGVDHSWDVLNESRSAPHFVTGEGRILQCRPLSVQGAALRTNSPHTPNKYPIQIEQVAMTRGTLWLPDEGTLFPTVALMAYLALNNTVPLRIPADWPDDCSDLMSLPPWDNDNVRRTQAASGLWPNERGWWMHMEVPWAHPTWHWDCGAIRRSIMIEMALRMTRVSEALPRQS